MAREGYWSPVARARITRRRALTGAAALTAAASAAAILGCSDDVPPGRATPRRGGTLRTGTTLPLTSGLDPHLESGTGLAIFPRVYGYLLHIDSRDDSIIMDHAERIEQRDALTHVITLRSDVKFQAVPPVEARAVTATDVIRSIDRYRNDETVTNRTWHTTILDRIEVVDTRTLRITTKRPYAYTLQNVGDINSGAIISTEWIDSQKSLAFGGAGSGPFGIEQASREDGARIVRNDAYFRAPIPHLDAMEWHVLPDAATRLAAFDRQEIDTMPNDDAAEARTLGESSPEVVVAAQPSLACLSLGFRVDRAPFNDPRIRGAIDLSLDRASMVRDLTFGEGEAVGPVNPHLASGFWSLPSGDLAAASSSNVALDARRASARALLVAASAQELSFRLQVPGIPQLIDVATVLRDHMQRIGLTVALEELDLLSWYANLRAGNFEATLISQPPSESPDIPTRYYHAAGPEGTTSPFRFANADVDALIERSWGELDRDVRRATLLAAQRLMISERPILQLFTNVGYSSAWSYVRDQRAALPGSLAQYTADQWLAPR